MDHGSRSSQPRTTATSSGDGDCEMGDGWCQGFLRYLFGVSTICYVHLYLGEDFQFDSYFQMGWFNHQPWRYL